MALSLIEQVRTGIGDFTSPFILNDNQIQHYLTSNSDNITNTISELQPIVYAALASRGSANRIEELWEDTTMQAGNYKDAMLAASSALASKASPIIGGSLKAISVQIDMFDPDIIAEEELL